MSVDELLSATKGLGTTQDQYNEAQYPLPAGTKNTERFGTHVQGSTPFAVYEEVTRSDTDERALDYEQSVDIRAIDNERWGDVGEWTPLPLGAMSSGRYYCGGQVHAGCQRWTWEGRYGQYTLRLRVDGADDGTLTSKQFVPVVKLVVSDFLARAPQARPSSRHGG